MLLLREAVTAAELIATGLLRWCACRVDILRTRRRLVAVWLAAASIEARLVAVITLAATIATIVAVVVVIVVIAIIAMITVAAMAVLILRAAIAVETLIVHARL